MKLRTDFITNSSSASYVVKNITGTTKTMWDLLSEAAAGPWELVDWPHYNPDKWDGMNPRAQPKGAKRQIEFREKVAKLQSFPPYVEVTIDIAWGDGGSIFCPDGLRWTRTQSFEILDSFA